MSLIDNFYCKQPMYFSNTQAGILGNRFTDHQPYVISVCFLASGATVQQSVTPLHKCPWLNLRKTSSEVYYMIKFCQDSNTDPNVNCDLLNNVLSDTYESCLSPGKPPSKRNEPRSHLVKNGLLRSIRTQYWLTKKILKCKKPKQRHLLENKLKYFKKILKRTCNLAKINYYKTLYKKFEKRFSQNVVHHK